MFRIIMMGAFFTVWITVSITGCTRQDARISIPDDDVVKLSDVIKDEAKYYDRRLVFNGIYSVACGGSCCTNEFVLKEGIEHIKVTLVKGATLPKVSVSDPVRILGTVKATADSPYILAELVEVRK